MLNFKNIFDYQKDQIQDAQLLERLNKVVVTEELLRLINEDSSDSSFGVINGILCVESNGKINPDNISKAKRKEQKYGKSILKGLYKVHVIVPSINNLATQLKLKSKIDKNIIQENDLTVLEHDLIRLANVKEILSTRRKNNWNTGFWLIYGIDNDTTHYLWMETEKQHTFPQDGHPKDEEILKELKATYSIEYLSKFIKNI